MSRKLFFMLAMVLTIGLSLSSCKKDLPEDMVPDQIENHSNQITAYGLGVTVVTDSSDCFSFVYPINLVYPDGSVQTATDDESLFALMTANPAPWDFEYPFSVTDSDGGEIEIQSFEDLNDLIILCLGEDYDDYWEDCPVFEEGFACYEIVFPVSLVFEDGSTETANDEDEFWDLLTSDVPPVDFVYPLTLLDEDGEELVANDADELYDLLEDCDEFEDWPDDPEIFLFDCYDVVYPFEVELEDGEIVTIESEDDFLDLLFSDEPFVNFVYPLTLVDEEGEEIEVENEDELHDALEECEDFEDWPDDPVIFIFGCYDVAYPFEVELENNDIVVIENEGDFLDVLFNDDAFEDFVYPLTLIAEDGEEIEVADEDELMAALEDCDNFGDIDPGDFELVLGLIFSSDPNNPMACYEIVFPISFETEDGIITAADHDELLGLLNGADWPETPVYPFEVIDNETGDVITVENADDLEDLLEDCEC